MISRVNEILNLVKKQINLLTKKEISYIIVVGCSSDATDFDLVIHEVFSRKIPYIEFTEKDFNDKKNPSAATDVYLVSYSKPTSIFVQISVKKISFGLFKSDTFNDSKDKFIFAYAFSLILF